MAAVVAHQQAALWHRRLDHFHIPDVHFTGMMPQYENQRTGGSAPTSRSFLPATTQMDLSLPLFSANGLPTSVPYQSSGTFAYGSSVDPYNMQQSNMQHSYSMNYTSNLSPAVSYADRTEHQSLANVHEARHAFALDNAHLVKAESASPAQSSPVYNNTSYTSECKRSSSEPMDPSNINFATDVDTLMKAIQAKQTTSTQQQEAPPKFDILITSQREEPKVSQKPRKRYQCHMPDCNKSFFQKTHLEIHIRAHTGAKPFVSLSNQKLRASINRFPGVQGTRMWSKIFSTRQLEDKELWEYFASLYKNSNKGIKGRGKDRRISAMSSSASVHPLSYSTMPTSNNRSYPGLYNHNGSDRSSRSSSACTDLSNQRPEPNYDFNAPMQAGYPTQGTGYDDMVFPERKMY
ncbi:hypothetical protein SNOG_09345 [Parastagonospora nodorum SN15]|uniref:C2H2-type domain-containing protein n=1 Tax=Phaeosphaeria nodorum (strain SN15 / ATCC MYA-4574 / FGSC 10173) TaxID=321614 RepID=Q0UFW9_PHANO|nr:hypothetical protein SNOG_09345 [Parastagonospora nodorum SN15]EAT83537.2 hypothetical protein SNOG_09345 [Parastagonospora nodorum SN15]